MNEDLQQYQYTDEPISEADMDELACIMIDWNDCMGYLHEDY